MENKIEQEIGKLININKDACKFYESAQKKADNRELVATFSNLENLHHDVILHLQQHIRHDGETLDAQETFTGQTQKFWGELMASISNDIDAALVSQLEEAEDRCLHCINDVMESRDLPVETRMLLQNEANALKKSHDHVKALKMHMKAA